MGSLSKSVFQAEIQTLAGTLSSPHRLSVPLKRRHPVCPARSAEGAVGGQRGRLSEPTGSKASLHAVAALISISPGVCPHGLSAQ